MALAVLAAARYRTRVNPAKRGFHVSVAASVLAVALVFHSLGELIVGSHSASFDPLLIAIDQAIFGVHPTVWLERFANPQLTDLLQLAYL